MSKYLAPHDAVINFLRKNGRPPQILTVHEPYSLDSDYLFPNEQSNRPTEHSVVVEFLRQRLSTHEQNSHTIS